MRSSERRHSPTDLDDAPEEKSRPTPSIANMQFDYRYKGGAKPWPERHKFSQVKFGPALIKTAWKVGLVVIAEIEGFPHPVAVTESRWNAANCFEVKTAEGWRLPSRVRTLKNIKGLQSTGEYVEP